MRRHGPTDSGQIKCVSCQAFGLRPQPRLKVRLKAALIAERGAEVLIALARNADWWFTGSHGRQDFDYIVSRTL